MQKLIIGTSMKKLLTAFVIFVYFVPASIILTLYTIFTQETPESSSLAAFVIPLLLMLAVCVLVVVNIAGAVYSVIHSQTLTFRTVMVFKLCLIPFYIVNFACWLLASMVFHIALVVWPIIPFIIAYTYFTMLGTSVHIITKLFMLRRDGTITTKQLIIHFIWQIMFTADVIDSIYLAIRKKKFETTLTI